MRKIIADGNNVARYGIRSTCSKRKGRFKNIALLMKYCKCRQMELITLVSPYLKKHIDDKQAYEHCLRKGAIIETPVGMDCDLFILETAKHYNTDIISNDSFKDYKKDYPDVTDRRKSFVILEDAIIIPGFTTLITSLDRLEGKSIL